VKYHKPNIIYVQTGMIETPKLNDCAQVYSHSHLQRKELS